MILSARKVRVKWGGLENWLIRRIYGQPHGIAPTFLLTPKGRITLIEVLQISNRGRA